MNDGGLAGRLAGDLDGAFPSLVRAYEDRVYSIAFRLLGEPHAAEDAAHDAFVRAYRALAGYSPERRANLALRPWLVTIALNAARNASRARSGHERRTAGELPDDLVATGAGPEGEAMRGADAAQVSVALRALPETQRVAVVLRHLGGLSYKEMAETLERPVGTVKAEVHRGIAALRAMLHQEDS